MIHLRIRDSVVPTPFEIGQVVQVIGGPLDGLRGILVKVADGKAVLNLGESLRASLVMSVERIAAVE